MSSSSASRSDQKNADETADETLGFIFIYEVNGEFYSELESVKPVDGTSVTIHPVYYSGYNNNMESDEIVWNEKENRYISTSEDGSWLDTIKEYPNIINPIDTEEVLTYEGYFYHCNGCVLHSLVGELVKTNVKLGNN